jgi:uncharacterized membrane protein
MANYVIIGGDGKEYGPITSADIRQWLAEGRLSAQSLAKSESDAEFRPLEKFPEFADAFARSAPAVIAPLPSSTLSNEDYELDLGGCVSGGYELVKKNFGTLFLTVLVLLAIQIIFSSLLNMIFVGGLGKAFPSGAAKLLLGFLVLALNSTVIGPLLGGLYLIYLKTVRGEPTSVGEIFAGFQKAYSQLFLGSLVVNLIIGACMAPFNFVFGEKISPLLLQMQQLQTQPDAPTQMQHLLTQMIPAFVASLPILFICLIPATYLTVCWQFTLPLVIDKKLDFGAAMKTSWKKVNRHWWQVFGLTILVGLVSFAGAFACCIGILFTIPIGFAAMIFGYETIFSGKKD